MTDLHKQTDTYKLVDCEEVVHIDANDKATQADALKKGKRVVPIKALRCYTSCYSPEYCQYVTQLDNTKVKRIRKNKKVLV